MPLSLDNKATLSRSRRWFYLSRSIGTLWLTAIVSTGCAGKYSKEAFVKAEVSNVVPGGSADWSLTLAGPKLQTLLGFFPELGKWNAWHGAWVGGTKVVLFRPDGSTVRIYTNLDSDTWSRDAGDWPLKPEYDQFIAEELKAQGQSAQGQRAERDYARKAQQRKNAIKEEQRNEADRQRWLDAMPPSLKPLWPTESLDGPSDTAPLHRALVKAVPDEPDRIRALLSWYGSGSGPWSGFPSYEVAAENLLLKYPTPAIVAAIEGRELTAAQTEGAARLFGGRGFFWRARPDDLRLLPQDLKQRLLAHSLKSSNEDNRRRAQRAFGEQ